MIKEDNILIANKGNILTNGKTRSKMVYLGRFDSVENWAEEPMTNEELEEEQIEREKHLEGYADRVVELIRERYTINDELALSRQRDTKSKEFDEYFAYCEDCKLKAKNELENIF